MTNLEPHAQFESNEPAVALNVLDEQTSEPLDIQINEGVEPRERTKKLGRGMLRSAQVSMITFEMTPGLNESVTYGTLLASYGATQNPIMAGIMYGAVSYSIETLAALSAAPLLETKYATKVTDAVNDWMMKHKKKSGDTVEIPKTAKVVAAVYAGSVVAMGIEKVEKPEMTKKESRRFGLRTATWLGGVCMVEGGLITAGVDVGIDNPNVSLPALGIAAAGAYGYKKLRNKRKTQNENVEIVSTPAKTTRLEERELVEGRYDLSKEELNALESELVSVVREKHPSKGMVGVWIQPKSKYANFIRTHEASYFNEVQEVTEEAEKNTMFLAVVDNRSEGRIVHGATVTGIRMNHDTGSIDGRAITDDEATGFYVVDSLIELGNFSAEEFSQYYEARSIDPDLCVAVETNFRIGSKVDKYRGLKPADLAYLMFYNLVNEMTKKQSSSKNIGGIIASINNESIRSFDRIGLNYEPLMNRTDFVTEEGLLGKETLPVMIPYTPKNKRLFRLMKLRGGQVPVIVE